MSLSKRIAILLLTIISSAGCDQSKKFASKSVVDSRLPTTYLSDTIRVVYAENSGAFLGLGASWPRFVRTTLFIVFGLGILTMLASYASRNKNILVVELSAISLIVVGDFEKIINHVLTNDVVLDFLSVGKGTHRTGIFKLMALR